VLTGFADEPESAPFVNLTFDRQLVSLLEEAGLKGTTSNVSLP
jgi:hypothetical protein